ncbi:MAG TPA: site-specific integrase [Vicinamibacterales bacterium]|nr:site-specific integrase [Vicinamibacterales bacterium]
MKGSIVKRVGARGARYAAVWWSAGEQYWKGGFVRRKDAENYLNSQVRRVHDGTFQPVTPIKMRAAFEAWDDACINGALKQGTLKPSTARSYRSMVRMHLLPAFGDTRSDQLTPQVVAKWSRARADDIDEGALAPKTYNNLVNLLSVILSWARQPAQRYLAHNPLEHIKRLPRRQVERPFLEPDQIARLLQACVTPEDTLVVMLGVYAGLRRGELCALRFDDVDWGDGTCGRLWIRRAMSGGKVTAPKTKHSVRMVDIPACVLTNLKRHQETTKAKASDYLFQTSEGTPLDPDNMGKRLFVPLVHRANLPFCGMHALRHTFASLLISHGESIKYVSRQLGHASIQITADTYGHLFKETSIAAMGRLDRRAADVDAARLALPDVAPVNTLVM